MLYLIAKGVISGVIIMAASEIAKRSPTYGSLILSLPLISILAFIWLWRDTGDNERIASLAEGTFWLVLPTLPLFLVLPALLRSGIELWTALTISCAVTIALYVGTVWLLPKVGINLNSTTGQCPLWVKSGLSSQRHSMSALPLKADMLSVMHRCPLSAISGPSPKALRWLPYVDDAAAILCRRP